MAITVRESPYEEELRIRYEESIKKAYKQLDLKQEELEAMAKRFSMFHMDALMPTVQDIADYCQKYGLNMVQRDLLEKSLTAVAEAMLRRFRWNRDEVFGDAADEVLRQEDML